MSFTWSLDFLHPDPTADYALVILNQPFSCSLLETLWSSARLKCCADGGANRLYRVLSQANRDPIQFLPGFIKGDLDSITPSVKQFYASHDVSVILDTDQNSTDLMKCFAEIETIERNSQQSFTVVILGGLSGRLDQTVHTLSFLHKLRKHRERVFAITDDGVGWVLDSGEHSIDIDQSVVGPTCGLLPVGVSSTTLSTKGLVWDLDEAESSFDGLVSTSNAVAGDHVWVKTTAPIWWCIELAKRDEKDSE